MGDNIPVDKAGFKVVLYGLFHVNDIKNHPPFDQKSVQLLRRDYSEERIDIICQGLKWAVNHKEIDYKNVFPGMKYTNEEIIGYFEKTLDEMLETGICQP